MKKSTYGNHLWLTRDKYLVSHGCLHMAPMSDPTRQLRHPCRNFFFFFYSFHAPQLDYHGNIYYPVFLHTVPMMATDIYFFLKLLYISSCTSTSLISPPWISLGQEARRLRTSLLFLHGLSMLSRLCLLQTG